MKKWAKILAVVAVCVLAGWAQGAAPKVVKTVPQTGDQTVRPGLQRLRIVFDQDMDQGGHSLCTIENAEFPEVAGKPGWADKRTFTLAIKLKPDTAYGVGINSPSHKNFKNSAGEPSEVYRLTFGTAAPNAAASASAPSSPAILLQQGRYAEETEGDIEKAMELYRQAIEQADRIQRIAAEATYHLALCYLKMGDKAAARQHMEKVIKDFSQHAAVAEKAQQQLKSLAPEKVDSVFDQVSMQALKFIAEKYGTLAAEAGAKSLFCNAHIHYVDADFASYSGGLGYHYNWMGHALTGRVRLGGTSYPDQTLYDASGEKLDIEIVADSQRNNFYHIYWIPKEPLKPQEALYYGWSKNKKAGLPRLPDSGGAMLTMQNKYGPKVLETFFLVLPAGLGISDQAEPADSRDFGDYKVFWWTKEVPENTNHVVNAVVRRAGVTDSRTVGDVVAEAVRVISTSHEGDPQVSQQLKRLDALDSKMALAEVAKHLDSEEPTVRRAAIYICWRGGFEDLSPAEEQLIRLCSHSEALTRGMATLPLGGAKVKASYNIVVEMTLNDKDGYARRCAAYALGLYGDPKALDVLQKALHDKDPLVASNAQAAIGMLSEKKDK